MEDTNDKKTTAQDNKDRADLPFVNEECGDTMWDEVLKEADERLKKALDLKKDDRASATQSHDDK